MEIGESSGRALARMLVSKRSLAIVDIGRAPDFDVLTRVRFPKIKTLDTSGTQLDVKQTRALLAS